MSKDNNFDFSKITEALFKIENSTEIPKDPVWEACKKIDKKDAETKAELEKYRQESLVDSLTGCYNRNYFEKFKKENFDPNRDDNNIALVFIDLNDLKKTNDVYGHEAGDKLIKDAVSYFKSSFRKDDTVIRLGGDEFVVLCRNYKEENDFESGLSHKVGERRSKNHCPSFAFGVAAYNKERDLNSLENTQKLADERMYQDKKETKGNR